MRVMANYYQHFDADYTRDVPAEGYGGWQRAEIEIAPEHTAVVIMHALRTGSHERYPGWYRAVEYIPRAEEISRTVFPPLLAAVRSSPLGLIHVVGGGSYYQHLPGYHHVVNIAGPEPVEPKLVVSDPSHEALKRFRAAHVFAGEHNRADIDRGIANMDFLPEAQPVGEEPIANTTNQLLALCQNDGINHLIYAGFAINWCLLLAPGGMEAMSKHGVLCSTIRQAVTAVENKETAREELGKQMALWRVALSYGFVFDVDDLLAAFQERNNLTN